MLFGKAGKLLVDEAELLDLLFQYRPRKAAEHGVGSEVGADKVEIDVLAEAGQQRFAVQRACAQRLADEHKPLFVEAGDGVFVHAPGAQHVDIVDERRRLGAKIGEEVFVGKVLFGGGNDGAELLAAAFKAGDGALQAVQDAAGVIAVCRLHAPAVEAVGIVVHEQLPRQLLQAVHPLHELAAAAQNDAPGAVGKVFGQRGVLAQQPQVAVDVREEGNVLVLFPFRQLFGGGAAQALGDGTQKPRALRVCGIVFQFLLEGGGVAVDIDEGAEERPVFAELLVQAAVGVEKGMKLRLAFTAVIFVRLAAAQDLEQLFQRPQLGGGEGADLLAVKPQKQLQKVLQVADLCQHRLRGRKHALAHGGVELAQVDVFKRRTAHAAALLHRRRGFRHHPLVPLQILFGQAVVEGAFDVQNVRRVFVLFVDEDGLVQRNAQAALAVQRLDGGVERCAQPRDLFRLGQEGGVVLLGREGERLVHLFQKFLLIRLARMQFKAEIADADAVQPLFDYGQRRLLFRHEQHPLVRQKAVGDDIGDGLALARAGRPVQDEGRPRHRLGDGGKLRAVGGQRADDLCGGVLVFRLIFKHGVFQLQAVIQQRADDGVFGKGVDVLAHVVPHGVAGEGELRQIDLFAHFPAIHVQDRRPHHGQHLGRAQRPADIV